MGLYFITFTLRYDPRSEDDLSVEGLLRRKLLIRDAVSYVWSKYLKRRGRAMAIALEVSPRGAVHIHALYFGCRPDVSALRAAYMFKVGDSPILNCKYVQKPAKAIRELAKYMLKAASPKNPRVFRGGRGEFIDPILAARAEVAFSGHRLFECFGSWRGAEDDQDVPETGPTVCAHCGGRSWVITSESVSAIVKELPLDWVPKFGRAGPRRAYTAPSTVAPKEMS